MPRSTWTSTEFCQDGAPWRKRIGFLATQLQYINDEVGRFASESLVRRSIIAAAMRGCNGHGTCTRIHRPHQLLQGIQPSTGRFYTIVAEPYPRALFRRLVEAFALSIDRRYRLHPVHDIWAGKFREEGEEKKSRSCGAGNAVAPQLLEERTRSFAPPPLAKVGLSGGNTFIRSLR